MEEAVGMGILVVGDRRKDFQANKLVQVVRYIAKLRNGNTEFAIAEEKTWSLSCLQVDSVR